MTFWATATITRGAFQSACRTSRRSGSPSSRPSSICRRGCASTRPSQQGKDKFTARHLDYILDFAEKNGLTVAGCAFGNLACSVVEDGEITGFFEVWLPIEETDGGKPKILP
jgi:hypothetical protein